MENDIMKIIFLVLFLLSTINGESICADENKVLESLQSRFAPLQKKMAQESLLGAASQSRQEVLLDFAKFRKHERVRKTISAIGITILIPAAVVSALLGGAALRQRGSSKERIKGIKWLVVGVMLMLLASYWSRLVANAISLLSG